MTESRPGGRHDLALPTVVTTPDGLQDLLHALSGAPFVAVDTESNSLYAYYHRVCLIQISLAEADYLVDPLAVDVAPLGEFFGSLSCQKVFHAAENDILVLKRDYGFAITNVFDTMAAARILGWPQAGMAAILSERFGVYQDKQLQRTDWGKRPLTPAQLVYAQIDTHYLLPLREEQIAELKSRRRWDEAQEHFDRLASLTWEDKPFDPNGFWRLDGTRDLTPRELAVLRELFLYREQQAQRLDRPPFKVFDNRLLISLSRAQPTSPAVLRRVPGMTAYLAQRFGDDMIQCIARGRKAEPPEPVRRMSNGGGRPDPRVTARYDSLRAWRTERARQRGVDPDIVLANDALMAIARLAPTSLADLQASDIMGPWRLQEYGPDILELLAEAG